MDFSKQGSLMPAAQLNISGGLTYLLAAGKAKSKIATAQRLQAQPAGSINDESLFLNDPEPINPVARAYLVWELRQNNSTTILKQGQVQVKEMDAQKVLNGNFQQLRQNLEIDLNDIADTTASLTVKLVNLDGTQVWFDDLEIKHLRRNTAEIIQADHYDPFGMLIQDLGYRKPKEVFNKNLYNAGSKWQQELQWYSTFYRQYDPQLGRFQQVDPAAESYFSYKPYQYCGNNPVIHNDSLGDKFDVVYRPEHFQLINKKN